MIRADDGGDSVRAVAFGAAKFFDVVNSAPVDLIFQPTIDSWEGETYVKCMVKEIVHAAPEKIPLMRENTTLTFTNPLNFTAAKVKIS